MDATFAALTIDLAQSRDAGEVLLWIGPRSPDVPAEEALRTLLRNPPGPLIAPSRHDSIKEDAGHPIDGGLGHLDEITAAAAGQVLRRVLNHDLAYDAEIMPEDLASDHARRVIDTLPEAARWWTNGDLGLRDRRSPAGWTPLSDATFDTGVIGVSDTHILVAWFMDED